MEKENRDTNVLQTKPETPTTTSPHPAPTNPVDNIRIPPPSHQPTTNLENSQPPISIEVSHPIPTTPTETPQEYNDNDNNEDAVLSVLRSRLRKQSDVRLMAENLVRGQEDGTKEPQGIEGKKTERENVGIEQVTQGEKVEEKGEEKKTKGEKGLSVQAKRRAAKRRIMLAFEDGM
jgi:hypothetical protein